MEIKDLDKRQYILLTLLITFVVSIATGIVTVSLMNQMPKSVPQTINNVIQRTIEKVTTVQVPATTTNINDNDNDKNNPMSLFENSDALVSIYHKNKVAVSDTPSSDTNNPGTPPVLTNETENENVADDVVDQEEIAIGQGVIISDIGLILVESNILTPDENLYKVVLDKKDFDATVLKSFGNGFAILRISTLKDKPADKTPENKDTTSKPQ